MKILMVCLGNICRSPLGEGILQHKASSMGLDWKVDSAGIGGWHVGNPPHHMSQRVARKRGIDISSQRGRKLVREDFLHFDRIYFMDKSNYEEARRIAGMHWEESKCCLLLEELYRDEWQSVPDPYGHPEKDFEMVFDMIDSACDAIIRRYG